MSNSTLDKKVAIRIENVHKSFRHGRDKVLRGISIDFYDGELTYILGPSGTGKSVLIKHVLGLLQPDQGKVYVHGQDMSSISGDELAKQRELFGMLFQNAALFDDFTVYDNVAFPLREHTQLSEGEIREKVHSKLAQSGMPRGYDKYPNELSGGMRKRVGLARAIIREPKILLYDEPTTGLDPVTRMMVDDLIDTMKKRLSLTSVVISHDIPSALRLADRIVFLYEGNVAFHGSPQDLRHADHPKIKEFLLAEQRSVDALS